MEIHLDKISKKFSQEWIFKNVTLKIQNQHSYALVGPNGSGKSTLMQIISGILPANRGKVAYFDDQDRSIDGNDFYQYLMIVAPYMELIEEFTLREFLTFHFRFKKYSQKYSIEAMLDLMKLSKSSDKLIKHFSSGMKQRLKLGLAFFSSTPVLFLDEPTSNLDLQGVEWYQENMQRLKNDRTLIICSNQPEEYAFCDHQVRIMDFK